MAIISGTSGPNNLQGTAGADVIASGGGRDVVNGQGDADVISGGANKDRLIGGEGNDVMDGGGSDDILSGGEGNDILFGGGQDDRLIGGNGADKLIGGNDDDVMYLATTNIHGGGDGFADIAYFDANDGNDKIYGFDVGIDKIALDGASYSMTTNGVSTFITYGATSITVYNAVLSLSDIITHATIPVFGDFY